MSSVDNQIVNMQFNNKQFSSGVAQSQRDLAGLDKTIANAGKSTGLKQLGDNASLVSQKFSAMQIATTTAIATIANKVTNAGINMVKSFTIKPIMDGLNEYHTTLQSTQTIMANTGKSVKVVNATLDELNSYSDKTIYNFAEMAKNIGTFTAAGVKLPEATSAIKGIANIAALSGSTSQQASGAMYQLSQAIAAGRVNLQDWNSVVNSGMGGKVFQTRLVETAVAMGAIEPSDASIDKMGKLTVMGQTFRESLSATGGSGWFTSDVLTKTLATLDGRFAATSYKLEGLNEKQTENRIKRARAALEEESGMKFSEAQFEKLRKVADASFEAATQVKSLPQLIGVVQESIGSMWASGFKLMIGDFQQSKKMWTKVSDAVTGENGIMTNMSHSFLGTLRTWKAEGGRKAIVSGLKNSFEGLGKVLGAVKEGFKSAFSGSAGKGLAAISKGFERFTENLIPSEDTIKSISGIFGGLFSILHLGLTVIKGVAVGFSAFFGALFKGSTNARGGILSVLGSVGETISAFEQWITQGGKLTDWMSKFGSIAGAVFAPVLAVVGLVVKAFAMLASGEGLDAAMAPLNSAKEKLLDFVSRILGVVIVFTQPFEKVQAFFEKLQVKLDSFRKSVDDVASPINGLSEKFDKLDIVPDKFNAIKDSASKSMTDVAGKMGLAVGSGASLKDSVSSAYDVMSGAKGKAAVSGNETVTASAAKTASVFESVKGFLSRLGPQIKSTFGNIGDSIKWVGGQLGDLFGDWDALEWASMLNALFTGVLLVNLNRFMGGMQGFGGIGGQIKETFTVLQKSLEDLSSGLVKAEVIKAIAIAVGILTLSLIALSFVDIKKLGMALGAMGIMMTMMTNTLSSLMEVGKDSDATTTDLVKIAAALFILSLAILNLSAAVAILGNLDLLTLAKGIGAMGIMLALLIYALERLAAMEADDLLRAAGSLLVISIALNVLVGAVAALGLLPLGVIQQGISTMAIALGLLVGAMLAMDRMKGSPEGLASSLLLMSISLVILTSALTALGLLPLDVLVQGFVALAIGLGMMVAAMVVLSNNALGTTAAATSMVLMAVAMNMLVGVILTLGLAPWDVVMKGLIGVGLAFAILLGAAAVAMAVAPGLYAIGAAVGLLGLGLMLAGLGVALFAGGLALLATVGVAAIAILVIAFHTFMALLPTLATQVAAAFVAFLKTIAAASPKIRKAMGEIIDNLLGIVSDAIPDIGRVFLELLEEALRIIVEFTPKLVLGAYDLIIALLEGLEEKIPMVVTTATDVIIAFIEALSDNAVKLANAGADALIDLLNGLSDAVETKGPQIRAAMKRLVNAMKAELKILFADIFSDIPMPSLPNWDIKGAVTKKWDEVTGKGKGISAASRVSDLFSNIKKRVDPVTTAVENLAKAFGQATVAMENLSNGAKGLRVGFDPNGIAGRLSTEAWNARVSAKTETATGVLLERDATKADNKVNQASRKVDKAKSAPAKKKAKAALRAAEAASKKAQTAADRQQTVIERAEANAEKKERLRDQEITYNAADTRGKGDVRNEQAMDKEAIAQDKYALAAAKRARAARLKQALGGKKATSAQRALLIKLHAEATAESKIAEAAAKDARAMQTIAEELYREANKEDYLARAKVLEDSIQAEKDAEVYEKSTIAEQKAILQKRIDDQEKIASDLKTNRDEALETANLLMDTDMAAANKSLELAEQYAAEATAAAEKAAQAKQDLEALTGAKASSTGDILMPSRSALEDAAKAVDRYTASMRTAEELAADAPTVKQYVQNNYSPEALSPKDVYRHTKNLISITDSQMSTT